MRFTDFAIIDPIMSIGVAAFIFINAIKNLKEALNLFLEKAPRDIKTEELIEHLLKIEGVLGVHHIHIWSLDGINNYATMHVITNAEHHLIKDKIREELREHGIGHATLELEGENEHCHEKCCHLDFDASQKHHHHHH